MDLLLFVHQAYRVLLSLEFFNTVLPLDFIYLLEVIDLF